MAAVQQSFTCQACQRAVTIPAAAEAGQLPPSAHAPPGGVATGASGLGITEESTESLASNRLRSKVGRSTGSLGLILMMMVGCVVMVLLVAGFFQAYQTHPEWFHEEHENVVEGEGGPSVDPVVMAWADATSKAVLRDEVRVKVERVEFGPVRGKDARNAVRNSGNAAFLQIYFKVRNQRQTDVNYKSWYGNKFNSGNSETAASLTDNLGTVYSMMVFSDIKVVQGHTSSAVLGPADECTDVIIYEVPAEVNRRKIEYLRLQLPAAAVGGAHSYRFQIPKTMAASF